MPSDRPGEIVGELITLFDPLDIGIRLAADKSEAGNVRSHVGTARRVGIKILQAATGVLEAKFVDLVGADGHSLLHHAGHVAIGLLGSARKCVLPVRLVLSIHLNAGHRAGTYVGAKHQPVIAVDVVIQAEGVKAGAFENRIVSSLRHQAQEIARQSITQNVGGGRICRIDIQELKNCFRGFRPVAGVGSAPA